MSVRRRVLVLSTASLLALSTAACGGQDEAPASASPSAATDDALLVYSGRNEELVSPILEKLEQATGVDVEVRYGGSSELAAQLLEEGDRTEADLFFSQDAGALGALAKAGRLQALPAATTEKVEPGFSDPERRWVATSARARVIAYHPERAPEVPTMTSIDAVLEPAYRGKVAFAPTNASFHAFVTALRVSQGEEAAKAWLERFKANEPQAYDSNTLVLDAVDRGEVSLGLINHYYWYERVAEKGADAVTARTHFLDSDDPGALVNVAGVGLLAGSEQRQEAQRAVDFLLSDQGQQYFADETAEYPVVPGITSTTHDLAPLGELTTSSVDLGSLDSLETTLALLDEVGLT
ncbi:MAG TPA: extracellular solute-binding protein [Dermatophilaceae bacterium]|nr:extracellular solute-binding protein [Dermatophilaceae bacterium]